MWSDWATRYCLRMHLKAPVRILMGYLLLGFLTWISITTPPSKQELKLITKPKTAADFTKNCHTHFRNKAEEKALIDCNKAISLDASLPEAYFQRSRVWKLLGNKQAAIADYYQGRQLLMERNRNNNIERKASSIN